MSLARLPIVAVVTALVTAGCADMRPLPRAALDAPREPYRLDAGDKVRLIVFDQRNLSNTYTLDPSGQISMPLVGDVPAAGLTVEELAGAVEARLRRGYIREPDVSVEIDTYRPFYILGEVTQPGQYPYVAGLSIEKAVAVAGGYTPRAVRREVELQRRVGNKVVRVLAPADAYVRPGDTIYVRERFF